MAEDGQITVDNAALLAAIDGAIALLQRPRQLFEEIGAKLESNANLRFDSKTDPTGAAWLPISPATRAIYESEWFIARNPAFKGGIPGSLLERTRQLRDSLGYNPGDDFVELGTSRRVPGKRQPYWEVGVLHEWGTVKMPRRGIFTADPKAGKLGSEDEADVLQIVNDAILGAFG
jgi:phage gpG-like protein